MQRTDQLNHLNKDLWDVIIIGGGATGLGIALDSTTRGYKTLLLERKDFTHGTSSRSTKLLHGGVRYLAQGNFSLVYEALHERNYLIQNAPHLCRSQAFIIPCANFLQTLFYGFGLKIYALMAGKLNPKPSSILSQEKARSALPAILENKLTSGVCYYDGQFDDARLGITLALSAHAHGATLINYMEVLKLLQDDHQKICGVVARDNICAKTYTLRAKVVINATGVFTNPINKMDPSTQENHITPSQGVHLVFDRKFLPTDNALIIPKTSDGRVLFAIPWHDKLVVGTTDTPIQEVKDNPLPLEEEIKFLLDTLKDYLKNPPQRSDILSCFAGLRPLIATGNTETKKAPRNHKIYISPNHLVHINGGKWTTYRYMAQETLNACIQKQLLPSKPCITQTLKLYGYCQDSLSEHLRVYGTDAHKILDFQAQNSTLAQPIHPNYPYTFAQVLHALQHEMAQSVEDVLCRRIRLLFLDAKAAYESASSIAHFMGEYLSWDQTKIAQEIQSFQDLAKAHLITKD
ncbi:glycerol-3-phosphate dehydrogenase/oxidase [Helicobacter felis]|uniref:glycerol-3-phosphate dehydrogenase/oxidase n=1 Tax=Helicobacter felis TaxID=214 RepID=UPI000CEDA081|nr:glycerol-3-phosphate dehydrogenase/oxidase [Helicobacter felis]